MNENRPLASLNFFLNPHRKDIFFAVRRIVTEQAEMAAMHPASLAELLYQANNPAIFCQIPSRSIQPMRPTPFAPGDRPAAIWHRKSYQFKSGARAHILAATGKPNGNPGQRERS